MTFPSIVLVDSCSYLRLGAHIHPNFWGPHADFGVRCIEQTEAEVQKQRIVSALRWPTRDPHPALRKKWKLAPSAGERAAVAAAEEELFEIAEEVLTEAIEHRRRYDARGDAMAFLSPVDLRLLATAFHFKYGLMTDELALTLVAKHLHLKVFSSMQMLRYCLDQQYIDDAKVDQVILRWHAENDLPHAGWAADFKRLFKRKAPKLA